MGTEEEGSNSGFILNQDFGLPGTFLPSLQGVEARTAAGGGAGRSAASGYRFGVAGGSELGGGPGSSSGGSSGSGLVVGAAATASVQTPPLSPPLSVSEPCRPEASGCGVEVVPHVDRLVPLG